MRRRSPSQTSPSLLLSEGDTEQPVVDIATTVYFFYCDIYDALLPVHLTIPRKALVQF
ncbi:hypothetical protein [Nostoc sp. NMS4]|uniref:hypothetical protein n=1 Tax=Nostoc sp. NMS4 TaxID=2815390 RepID=UPI0025F57EB5|nr:hypothetical protein [Nostoc sp. NMS4]MBN3926239.1 hypothetical protein [Nostoc sp. NMS4]